MNYHGYFDKYGMVTVNGVPGNPADNSENGLLFTAVAEQSNRLNDSIFHYPFFEHLFDDCFINGVLYRNPEPHPKPDSHDNYTAVVLGSLLEGNKRSLRKLLWSLIKHFGVVRGEFVGRFPQVWLLLLAGSFAPLKYFLFPFLMLLYFLQTPGDQALIDTSATQLQFVIVSILDLLFPPLNLLKRWFTKLKKYGTLYDVFKIYYGEQHPTTQIWKK